MSSLEILFSILITLVSYLLIPIFVMLSRKKFKNRTLVLISFVNGCLIFIILNVLRFITHQELSSNTSPAFTWSMIAYFLMRKFNLQKSANSDVSSRSSANEHDTTTFKNELGDTCNSIQDPPRHIQNTPSKVHIKSFVPYTLLTISLIVSVAININLYMGLHRYEKYAATLESKQNELSAKCNDIEEDFDLLQNKYSDLERTNRQLEIDLRIIAIRNELSTSTEEELREKYSIRQLYYMKYWPERAAATYDIHQ